MVYTLKLLGRRRRHQDMSAYIGKADTFEFIFLPNKLGIENLVGTSRQIEDGLLEEKVILRGKRSIHYYRFHLLDKARLLLDREMVHQ